LCGHEGPTTDWCRRSVENAPGCGSYKKRVEVSRLRGAESVMSQCGKFEINALVNREPMKMLKDEWVPRGRA